MRISHGVAGPRQGALERAAQVVERPRDYHIIVETHQRGHTQHPNTDAWQRRQRVVLLAAGVQCVASAQIDTLGWLKNECWGTRSRLMECFGDPTQWRKNISCDM